MIGYPAAVVDAGVVVLAVLDTTRSDQATSVLQRLTDARVALIAPCLWRYEVTSAIRKYRFDRILSAQEAGEALSLAFDLGVSLMDEADEAPALAWAERLNQRAAYDAFYLAMAEKYQTDFWTADERLANACHQLGLEWVHWVGEVTSPA